MASKLTQNQRSVPSEFRPKTVKFASEGLSFITGAGSCAHQTSAPTGKGQRAALDLAVPAAISCTAPCRLRTAACTGLGASSNLLRSG